MKDQNENWGEILSEQLLKESEQIQKEVELDSQINAVKAPEHLREKLAEKIEQYEREKRGESKEEQKIQNEKVLPIRRKKKKKALLLVAAVAVMILGSSMTSTGNREAAVNTVNSFLADRKNTNITSNIEGDSDILTQAENVTEEQAYEEIKDVLGFDAVRLKYMPEHSNFIDVTIDTSVRIADVLYLIDEQVFSYRMTANYQNNSFGYDIEDQLINEEEIVVKDVIIRFAEYEVEGTKEREYTAQFEYSDIYYFLSGIVEKDEFIKIVKNLHFFSNMP